MAMLAIDCSNYSGEITVEQARALYASGVRRAIVQIVNPDILTHRQQIPVLLACGVEVEVYVYVWFSSGEQFVRDRVAWACREAAAFPLISRVWLDCEQSDADDPPFAYLTEPTTQIIAAAVETVEVRGFSAGIYTARWWWVPGTSDSHAFAHLPLWNANYDGDPDLDPAGYGGWNVPAMEQYQGSTTLAGVPMVDLNAYTNDRFTETDAITLFRYAIGGNGIAPGVTVTPLARSPQGNRVFNVEMP